MPRVNSNKLGPTGPISPVSRRVTVERTYLTMESLEHLRPGTPKVPAQLEWMPQCSESEWRALYSQIGAEWHWHDRDSWDQSRIQSHLQRADVRIYRVVTETLPAPDQPAGFLELTKHADGSAEIVYLGLARQAFGVGLGGWLVSEAVRAAFAWGATRTWLHTCTLDSPAALPNYLARGFSVERTETYETLLSS